MSENGGWRPRIAAELRQLYERKGIIEATHTLLDQSNITVTHHGPVDAINNHEDGMLFVGNHSKLFEYAALMDVLSKLGKTSIKHVAKFYAVEQMVWMLGEQAREIALPVYPRMLASDRKNKLNVELPSRLLFRKHTKTLEKSTQLTNDSLQKAADELALGGIVNIYPRGHVINNVRKPWRAGVGRIAQKLPDEATEKVLYVPYHVQGLNPIRTIGAVASRGKGLLGRPQTIHISFGEPRSIHEMICALQHEDQKNPAAIADKFRQHYVSTLLPR